MVVVALGTGANPLVQSTTPDLETNRKGYIAADPETLRTSKRGVFAAGDIVTGAATVLLAVAGALGPEPFEEGEQRRLFLLQVGLQVGGKVGVALPQPAEDARQVRVPRLEEAGHGVLQGLHLVQPQLVVLFHRAQGGRQLGSA